jgi:hypothetical protein
MTLAKLIIELAKAGEREPERLSESALKRYQSLTLTAKLLTVQRKGAGAGGVRQGCERLSARRALVE